MITLPDQPELQIALALFAALAVLSAVGFFMRKKLQARGLMAFQLITLLLSLIGFLMLAAPSGKVVGWIAALGLVGTFWLMARFENTDRS
jgi:hypothetical protein